MQIDLRPYKVRVNGVEDDFDVRGTLGEFLWQHVFEGKWGVAEASEIEVLTDRLEALPSDAESFEISDREHELVMQAYGATRGPQRILMPFLRRLIDAT